MKKKICLLGGSGHALVVNELAALSDWNVTGYFDPLPSDILPSHIEYLGKESADALQNISAETAFFPAAGDNNLRAKLILFLETQNCRQVVLIHPDTAVSDTALIGVSTMVGPKAVINPLARIGKGVIINSAAVVEHECKIDDFAHIAPGAVLLGNVTVGKLAFIGANAVIRQGLTIGASSIVGAGAVVLQDVEENTTVVGNPAKKIR